MVGGRHEERALCLSLSHFFSSLRMCVFLPYYENWRWVWESIKLCNETHEIDGMVELMLSVFLLLLRLGTLAILAWVARRPPPPPTLPPSLFNSPCACSRCLCHRLEGRAKRNGQGTGWGRRGTRRKEGRENPHVLYMAIPGDPSSLSWLLRGPSPLLSRELCHAALVLREHNIQTPHPIHEALFHPYLAAPHAKSFIHPFGFRCVNSTPPEIVYCIASSIVWWDQIKWSGVIIIICFPSHFFCLVWLLLTFFFFLPTCNFSPCLV